jgi:hypothetical protein
MTSCALLLLRKRGEMLAVVTATAFILSEELPTAIRISEGSSQRNSPFPTLSRHQQRRRNRLKKCQPKPQ